MKIEWLDLLRGRDPALLDRETYASLTARLLRINPKVTILEAMLVGLIGGIAAWRVRDPLLMGLCVVTTVTVLLLPLQPHRFEGQLRRQASMGRIQRTELLFSIHVWLASLGIGAMTARALLGFDDPILHLNLIALTLGAAVTTIRDYYRPLVPLGKTLGLLAPSGVAAVLTGQLYYQVLAIGALFLIKIILDLALELYRSSLEVHLALSEKAALAEDLHARAEELQRLRSELIEAARLTAMGTMASALAHELNQPLTAVRNYVRASLRYLERDGAQAGDQAREGIELADEAAQRAGEIVRRIRSFVSGEGGVRKPEDLGSIVEDACTFGMSDAEARGVRHEVHLPPKPIHVLVDRIQIQQVLINLLQNALDALAATSGARISISARVDGDFAEVVVADNGPGISEAALELLFEPFRTTKDKGLGLGLAISRTIVEAHDGRLLWSSDPAYGTEFRFTLPLAPAPVPAGPAAEPVGRSRRKKRPAAAAARVIRSSARGRRKATRESVLDSLRAASSSAVRDEMASRYGIPAERSLGVPVEAIQRTAGQLAPDHDLASALWESGWYEAQVVAAMIEDPDRVGAEQMDRWCAEFDSWAIADTVCFKLFHRLPWAFAKVDEWARSDAELQRRAAFALLASLAVHRRDCDAELLACLPLVEQAAGDSRVLVRKGASWALKSIGGRRSPALRTAARGLAHRLAVSGQPTACAVGQDALRTLGGDDPPGA